MPDHCHLCGSSGAGVIFACISCGVPFCAVHHSRRSHGCKGRVAAAPLTPAGPAPAAEERRAASEVALDPTKQEKKGEVINKLKADDGERSSVAMSMLSSIPDPGARAAAVASVLLRSAEAVRSEGGFTRPIEETYVRITRLAEAGKPTEAWGEGAPLVTRLESEPEVGAVVRGLVWDVQPMVGEAADAIRSASRAVEDGTQYGAQTDDARVLLGKATKNYREGRLEEAAQLARHSRLTARKSLSDLALRIVGRLDGSETAGLEQLAREDAKAAIREAARFAERSGEYDREFVVANIAVAWDVVRRAKAKGIETSEYEMRVRQARAALDLADSSRATRLAAQVRDEVETRLARLARGAIANK